MFHRFYIELNKPNSFAAREAILHDLDDSHAQAHLQCDHFPDYKPKFSTLWLTDKSSLVDFVDDGGATGGFGLLISKKALAVFETLNLPPHRVYPLDTMHRGNKICDQYYWLQILSVQYEEWIDFSQSKFQLKSQLEFDPDVVGEDIKISDAIELKSIIETLGNNDQDLLFVSLVFNEKYKELNYDMFYLDRLDGVRAGFPVVSKRLNEQFESNKLMGYWVGKISIELK
jgi:hypothetical protein